MPGCFSSRLATTQVFQCTIFLISFAWLQLNRCFLFSSCAEGTAHPVNVGRCEDLGDLFGVTNRRFSIGPIMVQFQLRKRSRRFSTFWGMRQTFYLYMMSWSRFERVFGRRMTWLWPAKWQVSVSPFPGKSATNSLNERQWKVGLDWAGNRTKNLEPEYTQHPTPSTTLQRSQQLNDTGK